MRPTLQFNLLCLIFIWSLCLSKFGVDAAVNVTVDDTHPSILYQPAEFWTLNSKSCTTCLHPDLSLAYNQSYHLGTHVISTDDDDFASSTSSSSVPSTTTKTSSPTSKSTMSTIPSSVMSPPATTPPTPTSASNQGTGGDEDDHKVEAEEDNDRHGHDNDRDDDDDDDSRHGHDRDDHSEGGQGKSRRSFGLLDVDDPGFVDSVITAQFKFTGTAVYIYAIEPLFQSTSPLSPTAMNLTFTLDNALMGHFFHNESSPDTSDFASNILVFSHSDLDDKPHVLLVTVQPETTFIFDYMVYASTDPTSASSTDTPSPTGASAPSGTTKHNIATFAGAIAGSAGALGLLALCIFLSLCRRRRKAAQRERRQQRLDPERNSMGSDASSPRMIGPRPFVPRYFPGTVLPPSYDDQRTPYIYSDPEDIDAHSATVSEESSPSTTISTTPLITRTGIPILTIPSAPPPMYIPSPSTARSSTMSSISSPSLPNASSAGGDNGSRTVPITYADVPPSVAPRPADQLDVPLMIEAADVLPSFGEALSSPIVPPSSLLPLSEHSEDVPIITPSPALSDPIPEAGTFNDNADARHEAEATPENDTPTSTTTHVPYPPSPSASPSPQPGSPNLTPSSLLSTQSDHSGEAQAQTQTPSANNQPR